MIEEKRPSRTSAKPPPPLTSQGSDSSDADVVHEDEDEDYHAYAFKAKKRATAKSAPKRPEPRTATKMRANRSLMLAKATAAAAAAHTHSESTSHATRQKRKIRPPKPFLISPVKATVCKSHREKIASSHGRRSVLVKNVAARAVAPAIARQASSASVIPPYNASFLDLENISSDDESQPRKKSASADLVTSHSTASHRAGRESKTKNAANRKSLHRSHQTREDVVAEPDDEDTFEKRLDRHLATLRLSYIHFYKRMQTESFKRSLKAQMAEEEEKKVNLTHSASKLEKQISFLIKDSQELLLSRLRELGVEGNTPNDLLVIAHRIVEGHKTLQSRALEEQEAVEALEAENAALVAVLESTAASAGSDATAATPSLVSGAIVDSSHPSSPMVKREEIVCDKDSVGATGTSNAKMTTLQIHPLGEFFAIWVRGKLGHRQGYGKLLNCFWVLVVTIGKSFFIEKCVFYCKVLSMLQISRFSIFRRSKILAVFAVFHGIFSEVLFF